MTLPFEAAAGDLCLPRIVWMLWLQGWDKAPPVAQAARQSWERRSGWEVRALDADRLGEFLPRDEIEFILSGTKEMESISDLIRCGLLHRHGGVWADATAVCSRPLDDWLPTAAGSGFFAFADPGAGRALSNWFLASAPGHMIVDRWRTACLGYWSGRAQRHAYFWMHGLFAEQMALEPAFREAWSAVPKLSARHRFHFGPNSPALLAPPPDDLRAVLADPPVPVFKLSHKGMDGAGEGSLLAALCRFARDGTLGDGGPL